MKKDDNNDSNIYNNDNNKNKNNNDNDTKIILYIS